MAFLVENQVYSRLAPAKINLRLRVIGRDQSNYHLLEMLNARIGLSDKIKLSFTKDAKIISGIAEDSPYFIDCDSESNLCTRLAKKYCSLIGVEQGISIIIHKNIPAQAGLGGASSNAVAVLQILHELTAEDRRLDQLQLATLLDSIGADLSFYWMQTPLAWVKGRGEKVLPITSAESESKFDKLLLDFFINREVAILLPNFSCSTAEVYSLYRSLKPEIELQKEEFSTALNEESQLDLGKLVKNDLRLASEKLHPEITSIVNELKKIEGISAEMSGSGSAIFCFSNDPADKSFSIPSLKQKLEEVANKYRTKLLISKIC